MQGRGFAEELECQFRVDLASCRQVTECEWRRRTSAEKALALLGALVARQQ